MSLNRESEKVREAFSKNVPEVATGIVELASIAREAGRSTMVTVRSHDNSIHPVSACVGETGDRVKSIITDLGGEPVYIFLWSDSLQEQIQTHYDVRAPR